MMNQSSDPSKGKRNATLCNVTGLTVRGPKGDTLLANIEFSISPHEKSALVASNGVGKSTMLRALAGELLDGFEVEMNLSTRGSVRIQYVPQELPKELKHTTVIEALMAHYAEVCGDDSEDWRVYSSLSEVGLDADYYERTLGSLSGGEVNRAMLARALSVKPQILLLDEPTNHLDVESVTQFEELLATIRTAYIVVSHDRLLMDRCTDSTYFLTADGIQKIALPYSEAKVEFEAQEKALRHLQREQKRRVQKIKANVEWLAPLAERSEDMAKVYRAKKSALKRANEEVIHLKKESKRSIGLDSAVFGGKTAFRLFEHPICIPNSHQVLYTVPELQVSAGDRVVVLGRSGVGKSLLLNQIAASASSLEDAPKSLRVNPQVKVGYYDQQGRGVDLNQDVAEYLSSRTSLPRHIVHQKLVQLGIPYTRHSDAISSLSGGQRCRLQLCAAMDESNNVLILDEPTNHLDLEGIEGLENALAHYPGVVVFVSHDRKFIEGVANKFVMVERGRFRIIGEPADYFSSIDISLSKESFPSRRM